MGIQNLDTQKRCFLGTFFENIAILTHFDKTNPPHDINRWKAVDHSYSDIRSKINFFQPSHRKNFANALGQTCILDLRLRLSSSWHHLAPLGSSWRHLASVCPTWLTYN